MSVQAGEIRKVTLDTGVSPDFLEAALTQDITALEAFFDLVDNSIDAARDELIRANATTGQDGLPSSYEGYKISIRIDKDSIKILDNCSGINEADLVNRALYTARPSNHEYGIGQYGIGLKRSLLKMGTHFALSVDNGASLFKARFTNRSIGGNNDNKVYASEFASKMRKKSLFSVSKIKQEISNDLNDPKWFENAVEQFKVRYGIYLLKGLEIKLHNAVISESKKIEGIAPTLRTNGKFLPQRKRLVIDDVEIIIESGIHQDYLFPSESGHSISKNRQLTDYFGIYFSCNDRVIVSATTEKSHGWKTKWHSEYNGFVCWVKFVSKIPSKLPWNTSKTALRTDSSLFLKVKDELQPIADKYRSEIKKRYPAKKDTSPKPVSFDDGSTSDLQQNPPSPSSNTNNDSTTNIPPKSNKKPKPKKAKLRPLEALARDRDIFIDWNKCATIVPESHPKEYNIFAEMCRLESKGNPITCVVMLRVFLETTVKQTNSLMQLNWQNLSKSTLRVAEKLESEGYISHADKELIKQYSNTEEGLFSINNIQSHVHSTRFHPSQSMANTYWDELNQFLGACWKYIQDKEPSY